MSFTGEAVVTLVTQNLVRITGLSLIAGANGTIGFSDRTANPAAGVSLPPLPDWQQYELDGEIVRPQDFVKVDVIFTDLQSGDAAIPVSVAKTGTTHADFLITITNENTAEGTASGDLEIYVERGGR